MPTEIKKCDCKHEYQDNRYGKNMRVWNKGPSRKKCTVCGKTEKVSLMK